MSQNLLRVVIAEDEALIRLDLKEMLEEEGYSVVAEAGDGYSDYRKRYTGTGQSGGAVYGRPRGL